MNYFNENCIKSIKFDQYCKGRSELGSLVEICVKLVKRLIYGAIRNNVLPHRDFEFLVEQTVHLINRRPIVFKEALRDNIDDVPEPITPERLIHGCDLVSVNVIPDMHEDSEGEEYSPVEKIRSNFDKCKAIRKSLIRITPWCILLSVTSCQGVLIRDVVAPLACGKVQSLLRSPSVRACPLQQVSRI